MNNSLSMYADMIFRNGVVVTVDKENSICQAVAVKGNKIVYVGDDAGVEMWKGENTKVIDLDGRALLPGFIDSHMHLGMTGQNAAVIIDCNSNDVTSIRQIQEKIREAAAKTPKGAWIKATGYEQSKLAEGRHPTRDELDEAAPDNPVQLTRCCLHMGVYNTRALEAGGITGPEMFAPGEVIYTEEEFMKSFKAANDILLSYGVTSMHDGSFYGEETIGLYQEACRSRLIKVRMYNLLYHAYGKKKTIEWVNRFISTGIHGGLGDDHFRLGHVKILIDGSTSGPSCATTEPYSHDPNLKGIQLYTQEETDDIIIKAHNAGFNVSAHAVGDAAVNVILTSIERAMAQNPRPCRHRIEHCGIINEELLARIKKAGIVPIPNPGFFNENAEIYVKYYGDRVNYMFPLKSYLDNGIIAALGSDSPVIEADPMIGLYGAMTRSDKCSGTVAGSGQCIGIMDAIRMYTYNGAYASLEENIKGSIEPGKLADLVVLSENILETPVEKIKSVKADMTVIDGEIVYER